MVLVVAVREYSVVVVVAVSFVVVKVVVVVVLVVVDVDVVVLVDVAVVVVVPVMVPSRALPVNVQETPRFVLAAPPDSAKESASTRKTHAAIEDRAERFLPRQAFIVTILTKAWNNGLLELVLGY